MKPADFIAAGFVDAVRQRELPYDVVLLEATIPEVADGSALRFLQDFLFSAAQAGECPAGLCGISLGGHLALAGLARADTGETAARAARHVEAACLLAPYLGPRDIVAEAATNDGLRDWQAAEGVDDVDRQIWQWLQSGQAAGRDLHLGYGSEDRFAPAHALLGRVLPPQRVDVEPGAHDWPHGPASGPATDRHGYA
ncbi:hypothetical protein HK414_10570 [Ramlibacter terrae]|uniref:Alpha/beta hydrolase n=1 Tax=Ramlibacter terrae TaxID=2732511 RepID=A0ABX6P3K9_9BURK|nr:hypothetical protein HK414_10570 [Ramlibacter terrae]